MLEFATEPMAILLRPLLATAFAVQCALGSTDTVAAQIVFPDTPRGWEQPDTRMLRPSMDPTSSRPEIFGARYRRVLARNNACSEYCGR